MDWIVLLMIAGAIGNFIDRATQQYVVDFLYIKLINFPIFNVADIYVTLAPFLCLGLMNDFKQEPLGVECFKDE